MAKLLKQIWKTLTGDFFETYEEAAAAERKALVAQAFKEALDKTYKPVYQQYKADKEAYEQARLRLHAGESRHGERGLPAANAAFGHTEWTASEVIRKGEPSMPNLVRRLPDSQIEAIMAQLTEYGLIVPIPPQPPQED